LNEETKIPVTNLNFVERPFQVTVIGWLFIVVGITSTAYHLWRGSPDRWTVPILLVGIAAIVGGIYLLRGARWARWLLLAWLVAHVVAIAFESLSNALAHLVLLLVIGYFLLGPPAARYFQHAKQE
jgi:uncharacterized membrane protein HdeD (DUF308 family)